MCKNPSSVVLNLGCILESKFWGFEKVQYLCCMPDQLNQNSGGGNQGPVYLLVLFLFLIRIFKKFPSSFQCAAKIENHCSRWFWSSTSLETTVLTYPPGLFHLICYPDNILSSPYYSSSFCFILFRKTYFNLLSISKEI